MYFLSKNRCRVKIVQLLCSILLLLPPVMIIAQKNEPEKVYSLLEALQKKYINVDTNRMNTLIEIKEVYARLGEYPQLLNYSYAALQVARILIDNTTPGDKLYASRLQLIEGKLLRSIAGAHFSMGNIKEAFLYADSAIYIFRENNANAEVAYTEALLADILEQNGLYAEALEKLYPLLTIFANTNEKKRLTGAFNSIGYIYTEQGNLEQAANYLVRGKKIAEEISDTLGLVVSTRYISDILLKQGYLTQATRSYKKCLELGIAIGRKHEIAFAQNSIGNVYAAMGNYGEAKEKYRLALGIRKEIKDKLCTAQSLNDIGLIFLASHSFDSAQFYFLQSRDLREEMKARQDMAESYINIGKLFIEKKEFLHAKDWINKSIQLCETVGLKTQKAECYKLSATIYEQTNQLPLAIKYYKMYSSLSDSLYDSYKKANLSAEMLRYEFEKKETAARAEQEKAKMARQQRSKLLVLAAAIVFIISVLIILLFRQRNLKRKAIEKAKTIHTMAELEMQSLRAQLNPHFMFNSLNAIQELILKEDFDNSHTYLARFAKLLRILLDNADQPFVSLQQELDFLTLYLSLEKLRIPDMQASVLVDPGIDTRDTFIPTMIIQPYIENAIWHGLSHKQSDRKLQIRITKAKGVVQYEIEDNGVGRKKSTELKSLFRKEHKSKGMELLSKRFKLLAKEYGSDIETTLTDVMNNGEVAGTLVTIKVPAELSGRK